MLDASKIIEIQDWYAFDIPRKELRQLMKRTNSHGLIHVGLWLMLLLGTGYLAFLSLGSWWMIPAFFLFGVIYCGCDARWHETSHGTVFKTSWLNTLVNYIATTMQQRDIVFTKWEHANHHSYTKWENVDHDAIIPRPPNLFHLFLDFFYLRQGFQFSYNTLLHALGIPSKAAKLYVPEEEFKSMFWWARAAVVPYLIALGLAIYFGSIVPFLFLGLPRFYGGFLQWAMIFTQHAGLPDNVWDHRENTRTMTLNPVLSFLYMNMQYHIEHHVYPTIPFHQLPKLHERIKDQLPPTYNGLIPAYREIIPGLQRMRTDLDYQIQREIPTAPKEH